MAREYEYRGGGRRSGSFLSILLALLLGGLALGLFVHHARSGLGGKLAAIISGRPLTVVSAGQVVEKIQRLNRLETVVYSLDTVEEGSESSSVLPDALAGDKLLMIVHGQTIAGIDLAQLKPDSVEITEAGGARSIRLTLPPSQVFATNVDNTKTRVYARDTGIFVKADPNLETATDVYKRQELAWSGGRRGIAGRYKFCVPQTA